jgi:hypothetical protein
VADQERKQTGTEYITEPNQDVITIRDARDEIYQEETATEIAAPVRDEYCQSMTAADSTVSDENNQNMAAVSSPEPKENYQGMSAYSTTQGNGQYREETAAEIAAPVPAVSNRKGSEEERTERTAGGSVLAYSALALSILSLFILPVLFGAAGIVLGFIARRRGSALGTWAIGIGVISILIGIFILPFF